MVLSNPNQELFRNLLQYTNLIKDLCPEIKLLVDISTSNQFLENHASPALLKNLKSFVNNDFFCYFQVEQYEKLNRIILSFSQVVEARGPYIQVLCDKDSPFLVKILRL